MQLNALEVNSINVSFGKFKALDKMDIKIQEGCIFGLTGPNGAGKTTTINCIANLIDTDEGLIKIFGEVLKEESINIKRRIGILFENTDDLFIYLKGEEYLQFVGEIYGLDKKTIRERSDRLFDYFEMDTHRFMLINEYSKGMKKKIALASILLHNPDLIILDEPFDGLDAITVVKLKSLLKLLKEKGKTILITSHILSYIEDLTDEVAIINKGKVVFQAKTREIRTKVKNALTNETYASLEEIFIDITKNDFEEKAVSLDWIG